ncbi:MAG: type II secretion system protein [Endomicrobiia bacterium]|nr:type II secretion system protein [Endomicrobiia bacterium]
MKSRKGFTLIELMIVVAIIGILSAIAIPKFADLIRKSNEGATRGNLSTIRSAVSIYYSENEGVYPVVPASLTTPGVGATTGKYLAAIPRVNIPPYGGVATFSTSASSATNTYQWGYNPNLAPPTGMTRSQGEVWVDATETDSKGTVWNTY